MGKIEDENNFNEAERILGSRFWTQGLGQTFTRSEIRSFYLIAIHWPNQFNKHTDIKISHRVFHLKVNLFSF